ncbi:MAG: septum formation protein Maf [Omnitrophica bacterium RIFCSPLOWO2_12_FULL_50_11]|nr:MAG: septum formation protein Maf [Omnitrophica bacterium RIFCSPLOWO2_12_FULL_50_11]
MVLEHRGRGGTKRGTESSSLIYLASTSPRRKALLKRVGIPFRMLKPDFEEDRRPTAPPSRIVQIHAVKKADSCAGQVKNGTLLAADTVVCLGGKIFGKPANQREARLILGRLQGRWHYVYTGVAIFKIIGGHVIKRTVFFEKTAVRLKRLTARGIQSYVQKVNPLDKAGAYAIQSRQRGIVEEVKGSFSNAVGLPVEKILKNIAKRSIKKRVLRREVEFVAKMAIH